MEYPVFLDGKLARNEKLSMAMLVYRRIPAKQTFALICHGGDPGGKG